MRFLELTVTSSGRRRLLNGTCFAGLFGAKSLVLVALMNSRPVRKGTLTVRRRGRRYSVLPRILEVAERGPPRQDLHSDPPARGKSGQSWEPDYPDKVTLFIDPPWLEFFRVPREHLE